MTLSEHDLSLLLRDAADHSRPGPSIVSGAVVQGRRLRRRRRVLATSAGMLAAVAVGTAVLVLPGGSTNSIGPARPEPTVLPATPERPQGSYDLTGDGDVVWFDSSGALCSPVDASPARGTFCSDTSGAAVEPRVETVVGGARGVSYDGSRRWFLVSVRGPVSRLVALVDGSPVDARIVLADGPLDVSLGVVVAAEGSALRSWTAFVGGREVEVLDVEPERDIDQVFHRLGTGLETSGRVFAATAWFNPEGELCVERLYDDATHPTTCRGSEAPKTDGQPARLVLTYDPVETGEGQRIELATVDQAASRAELVLADGTVVPAELRLQEASVATVLALATVLDGASASVEWRVYGADGQVTDTHPLR